jgi:C-terminal processing protease CtpA/Prc
VLAGDQITAVDGAVVRTLGFPASIERMRGPEGSRVHLALRRGDAALEIDAERRAIAY